jgi:endo-1,4-beta-xylanase
VTLTRRHRFTRARTAAGAVVCAAALAACSAANGATTPAPDSAPPTQPTPASDPALSGTTTTSSTLPTVQLDGMQFGYSLSSTTLADDEQYAEIVRRDATIVTPENDMKWNRVHPERDVFDFDRADTIVRAAAANGQTVRGHVLVWHRQLPEWLENGDWTRDTLIAVMRDHITEVVGHYRSEFPGIVTQWDVVNEAFTSDGELSDSIWRDVIGDDYIELAFRFAREADPDALLFYNDFYDDAMLSGGDPERADLGAAADRSSCADVPKCVAVSDMASRFVRDAVPIDGIGFEAHIFDLEPTDYAEFAAWTGPLGLQWALTEVDVALPTGDGDDPAALEAQTVAYASMADACITSPNCNTMVVWGVSDGQSWIPGESDGERGHALLYREDYTPKPAARILDSIARAAA